MSKKILTPWLKKWPPEIAQGVVEVWDSLTNDQQQELLAVLKCNSPAELQRMLESYTQESFRLAEEQAVLADKFYLNLEIDLS